jgi:hypothetical protein
MAAQFKKQHYISVFVNHLFEIKEVLVVIQKTTELEEHLFDSDVALRKKGTVVKYKKIKQLARNIASRKNIEITAFKMTDNWIYRFCQRYGLCDRTQTHTAQECFKSLFDQYLIVSSFLQSIKMISSTYNPAFIFNMDGTPVYIDIPGERTIHFKGSKTVDILNTVHEKSRFTVTITINAYGDVLPTFVIFKKT